MVETTVVEATIIADLSMTLDELADACGMQPQWLASRVQDELIGAGGEPTQRFGSADLLRARRLAKTEIMFDVNADAAAFIVDLIEELTRLRRMLSDASAPDGGDGDGAQ